jgi:hypothetical protein
MSAESKNLKVICDAIKQHNQHCPWKAAEVRMNPFEVERLGWDDIMGLPIVPDADIGTGRFRIVCSQELNSDEEITEAVASQRHLAVPAGG